MGEVKRYEFIGGEMRERQPGWSGGMVYDHDYLALERERDQLDGALERAQYEIARLEETVSEQAAELTRLRAVEAEVTQLKHNLALSKILHHAAELKIREEHGHHMRTIEGVRNLLAEACGRKG